MKILVTGGEGQLGRAFIPVLKEHEIVSIGHDRLDITDCAAVHAAIEALAPDLVINTAAYNDVDGSESNRAQAHAVNATGPRNLAMATASLRIPLMHFSTDYVFDGALRRPYDESDTPRPLSAYGADKLAGEEAVRQLNQRHYIVRTAWLFSAGGRNFLNTMRAMSDRPQVRVVCDQSSSPTYVPHLAAAAAALIDTGAYGTFHLAGQGGTSKFELVRLCFSMLKLKTEVLPVPLSEFPSPARRPAYSVLTTTREPRITLPRWQEGLSEFVRALESGI